MQREGDEDGFTEFLTAQARTLVKCGFHHEHPSVELKPLKKFGCEAELVAEIIKRFNRKQADAARTFTQDGKCISGDTMRRTIQACDIQKWPREIWKTLEKAEGKIRVRPLELDCLQQSDR